MTGTVHVRIDFDPSPGSGTCAVLVGEDSASRISLAAACERIGILPVLARSSSDAAAAVRLGAAPLVVVFADHLQASPIALLYALPPHRPRRVMFGPPFGGVEHVLALELGFDEVWPADVTPLALNALLRTSLRLPGGPPASRHETSFGDITIDAESLSCRDGDRVVNLSPSYLKTLALLIARAPGAVSRAELRAAMPGTGHSQAHSRVVDVHVSRLRHCLIDEGVTRLRVMHVRGRGYRAVLAPRSST